MDNKPASQEPFISQEMTINELYTRLKSDILNIDDKINSLERKLTREIENIKYRTNMNIAMQTPPTYMDALSGNSITGGSRTINSHYLD